MCALKILPVPREVSWDEGYHLLNSTCHFYVVENISSFVKKYIHRLLGRNSFATDRSAEFVLIADGSFSKEAYRLEIQEKQITITYGSYNGLYYAFVTLKQLVKQYGIKIPCMKIEDAPEFAVRGALLDISRNKVPTLESLYQWVDLLADLKVNQLQLYIEGFSFAYPSFPELWKGETPITGEELQLLDEYCQERFMDLVPNQNSLGHMSAWLSNASYSHLKEAENGIQIGGWDVPVTTLNPLDPGSLELVRKMTGDLLPNFTSSQFNVNLDEPFELGTGKSKVVADEIGVGQLYANYVQDIYELVQSHGKEMFMWADVVSSHPDIIDQIPKDVTLLEWGYYNDHPFAERGQMLKESGHDFYFCPGTSSWMGIAGKTNNMMQNIANAVSNAQIYGAKGILIADWGDGGHLHYPPSSFAGFSYGAALAWNPESVENIDLPSYLDVFVYEDEQQVMGDITLQLGRYYLLEGLSWKNNTETGLGFMLGLMPKERYNEIIDNLPELLDPILGDEEQTTLRQYVRNRTEYQANEILSYLDSLLEKLDTHGMKVNDAPWIADEFRNTIRMLRVGVLLRKWIDQEDEMDGRGQKAFLLNMKETIETVKKEHKRLWLGRNKSGGLDRSLESLVRLERQINERWNTL